MAQNFDLLREIVSENLGEYALYISEVENILANLGTWYARVTIQRHLKPYRVRPQDFGINPLQYGVAAAGLYPQSAVWGYLQHLEKRGEIALQRNGIESFGDLIEWKYHMRSDRTRTRRFSDEQIGPGPSWDNAVRAYEE